ncbi:transcription elongation factor GreA [Tropicimonas isoalkanivorans]|uniref:Transcription elongation factor GreA n=2 Tax=Tropicimonas isoalkanivorans TaxID=441112 RepID=A0A1I1N5P4_9RHOB|nr:transcription elongation factor GreA [Tropicimonas isoalkanivorans]
MAMLQSGKVTSPVRPDIRARCDHLTLTALLELRAFNPIPTIQPCREDMEKIPMTRAGYTALDKELKTLKTVDRPAIIKAIAEAREHGDLSENAEYHSAREKQSFVEGRIKELESFISLANVIDPSTLSGPIKFGATVTIVDEDTDEEKTYQIVGEPEADLEKGLLNIKSPIARALIGKEEGDSIEVRTPGGEKSYEVLSIKYV